MTHIAFEIAIFALYAIAAIEYSGALYRLYKCRSCSFRKHLYMITTFGFLISITYLVLQYDWLASKEYEQLDPGTNWSWLLFEYFVVVFILSVATTVHSITGREHVSLSQ